MKITRSLILATFVLTLSAALVNAAKEVTVSESKQPVSMHLKPHKKWKGTKPSLGTSGGRKPYVPVQANPRWTAEQQNPAWQAKHNQLANAVDQANTHARWSTQMRANGQYAMPDKAAEALQQLKAANQAYNQFMSE